MRYVGVWVGLDKDGYVPYNHVGEYRFTRGIPQDIDQKTYNHLSKIRGFTLFKAPSTFFEMLKKSLVPGDRRN